MSRIADYKAILRLGAPILVGQLGMIVTGFADNIMVGRYSTEALASASFVNNVFNVVFFCCIGFTYGLLPLSGALFGRDDRQGIGSLLRNALFVNVLYGILLLAVMTVVYLCLPYLGQPEELLAFIRPYFLLFLAGILPVVVFNVFAQWSYSIRGTMMPMWIVLASNVLNILGNYALIYGKLGLPEMGLTGAGIATLAARLFCMVVIIAVFCLRSRFADYRRGFVAGRLNFPVISKVWRTSLPVSMQMTFESGSFSFAAVVAGWIGAIPLAAYQIFVTVGTLGFCLYYAVGSAVAVLVSNESTTGGCAGMRRVAWSGYHVMLAVAACSTTLFVVFASPLIHLFTTDPLVLSATLALIVPLALYQLGDATQVNFANALRGTSHVMPMLWIAFLSYIVVGAPATYVMAIPMGLGVRGIVFSFSVSLFLAGALFLIFFLRATRHGNLLR